MMFYICVKFHQTNISDIQITERKLLFAMFKGHNFKIIQASVMILALCILLHNVSYLNKVS